jgi:hypothetical protein
VVVGGNEEQLVAAALGAQGLDPGVELLCRKVSPEFRGKRRPE